MRFSLSEKAHTVCKDSRLRLPTSPFLRFDYMDLLDFCGKKKKSIHRNPDTHFTSLSTQDFLHRRLSVIHCLLIRESAFGKQSISDSWFVEAV